jgi:hypothetical protein
MSAGAVTQSLARDTERQLDRAKKLFIIGCPRSGTTWVQLLLAQHPSIATAPETQIFAYYMEPLRRQWAHERAGVDREQGAAGLSRLLTEAEFEDLCRINADYVFDRIAARNEGAEVVVEKSPKHALQADFIQKLFPDAFFLHVVRDPRDTAVSLLAASRSWGADWAPHNIIDAARMWRDHVLSARRAGARADRFLEVKYEALIADGVAQLEAIHRWLGVMSDRSTCEAAVAACDFSKLKEATNTRELPLPGDRSPKDFFRSGSAGTGLRELPRRQLARLEHVCGSLMEELGYRRVTHTGARARARIALHDGVQRVRESIDWQLQRLLRKV